MATGKSACAYGPLFDRMRRAVFEVYGYRCVGCGQRMPSQRLHAHHVAAYRYPCGAEECGCGAPKIAFGDLVPVCAECHKSVEGVKRQKRRHALPRPNGQPIILGNQNHEVEPPVIAPSGELVCWGWKHRSGWSGWLYPLDDDDGFLAVSHRPGAEDRDDSDGQADDMDPFRAIERAIRDGRREVQM